MSTVLGVDVQGMALSVADALCVNLRAGDVDKGCWTRYVERAKAAKAREEAGKPASRLEAAGWLDDLLPVPPAPPKKPKPKLIVEDGTCEGCGLPIVSRRMKACRKRRYCDSCRSRLGVAASQKAMMKMREAKANGVAI